MGMLVPAAIMAVSTALSAFAAIQGGRAAKHQADYESAQAEADARAEKAAAEVRASRIRDLMKEQRSTARASIAASGVDVGEGTPLLIEQEITARGEEDAILEILGGENAMRRGYAYAQGLRLQGRRARTAGYFGAASSLLRSGATLGDRWDFGKGEWKP